MPVSAPSTGAWTRRFHPADDNIATVLCLPHAGGSAVYFHRLSTLLAPRVGVLAAQYPGRADRAAEAPIDDLRELARRLLAALPPPGPGPLVVFGHSMGALLGYEVARGLEAAGRPCAALIVSGRAAPHCPHRNPMYDKPDAAIRAEIEGLGAPGAELLADPEIAALALPLIRADYKAVETYVHRPAPPLACPVHGLVGEKDPKARVDEVSAWAEHTTGGFDLTVFPDGGHFALDAQLHTIAELISATVAPSDHLEE